MFFLLPFSLWFSLFNFFLYCFLAAECPLNQAEKTKKKKKKAHPQSWVWGHLILVIFGFPKIKAKFKTEYFSRTNNREMILAQIHPLWKNRENSIPSPNTFAGISKLQVNILFHLILPSVNNYWTGPNMMEKVKNSVLNIIYGEFSICHTFGVQVYILKCTINLK